MFAIRSTIDPGLVGYFLWIGLMYVVVGGICFALKDQIYAKQCTYDGTDNVKAGGGPCSGCPDKLIMCPKTNLCWKSAMNFTIQSANKVGNTALLTVFQSAALDTACNQCVETSTDPLMVVQRVSKEVGTIYSKFCLDFHCQVLYNAYAPYVIPDLLGPTDSTCPNSLTLKPASIETECPCESLYMSQATATTVTAACSGIGTNFLQARVARLLMDKSACYRDAVKQQSIDSNEDYTLFAANDNCTMIIGRTTSVFQWFRVGKPLMEGVLQSGTSSANGPCWYVMCQAWEATLPDGEVGSSCSWENDPDLQSVTSTDLETIARLCQRMNDYQVTICNSVVNKTKVPLCLGDSTGGGASQRRAFAEIHAGGVVQRQSNIPGERRPSSVRADSFAGSLHLGRNLQLSNFITGTGTPSPTSSPLNDKLTDYTTGTWAPCACYQACVSGVQTRAVTCPEGVKCKEPKPPGSRPCDCYHCAKCFNHVTLWAFSAGYLGMGLISLALFLGFFALTYYDEDDFCGVGCLSKMLGWYCKALPTLLRFLTFIAAFWVILIIFQAIIPIGLTADCNEPLHVAATVIVTLAWLIHICFGMWMVRSKPMPPWLHAQSSARLIRMLCKPIKAIGP